VRADIILSTINAKWIHPSLALRLLKANLGAGLEERCRIIEFALRQPLREKIDALLSARPRILGLSVSIWNHGATIELLTALRKEWGPSRPFVALGGPEITGLPAGAPIFDLADACIRGEGESAFRELCNALLQDGASASAVGKIFDERAGVHGREDIATIKNAYAFYDDEDLRKKFVYVESSRGCHNSCAFCQSAGDKLREFPLDAFLQEMRTLIARGARAFKFLDRSFNYNSERAITIMEFFLEEHRREWNGPRACVHFEMHPLLFTPGMIRTIARFPPGTLRLEVGIQTLNKKVAALICRASNPAREIEVLRVLRWETSAIIHADLIAGLPGEGIESFAKGFDMLWEALAPQAGEGRAEIQLGILKALPGTPLWRRIEALGFGIAQSRHTR